MVPTQNKNQISLKKRLTALLSSTVLIANTGYAGDLPTGGSVAAGSVSIGAAENGTITINQSSANAVVNWQSYNIGKGNRVTYVQPDASSAILNRVTGGTTTTIAGSLVANGQVYLINPNGIAITPTGTVKTGAFVASTLGISDGDFMSGNRNFHGNGASASVTNGGEITIARGGYMALIGGTVDNSGVITVPEGRVALGSGEQATLDLAGDGFLQVAIPTGAGGSEALVSQSGIISADGGKVELKAAAAREMARQAVNMSGTIEAKTVSGRSGDIVLGGDQGEVAISGKIVATGSAAKGGKVVATGRKITLAKAKIDASGDTGGGTVMIGGKKHGAAGLQAAQTLTVSTDTTISADARISGNGGDIVLWSDVFTQFAGTITARGGAQSGNGGDVEVSGKAKLSYAGITDLSAAHGRFGDLLLDPYNVTISTGTDTGGFTAGADDSVINVNTLQTALATANVTISTGSSGTQAGTITVADAMSWTAATTLTLNAASDININAAMTLAAGGLTLTSGGIVRFAAPVTVKGAGTVEINASDYDFGLTNTGFTGSLNYANADGTAATSDQGGVLKIDGQSYQLLYSLDELDMLDGSRASDPNDQNLAVTVTGNYAFARNLDGTDTSYTGSLLGDATSTTAFGGILTGLGHKVSNLTIDSSGTIATSTGLVGILYGTLRDIGIDSGTLTGGSNVGPLAGYSITGGYFGASSQVGTIRNAYSKVDIRAGAFGGGLVGTNEGGYIANAWATGNVTGAIDGTSGLGGLLGKNIDGVLTDVWASGSVSGAYNLGGLVGYSENGSITRAHATGAVTGTWGSAGENGNVGGLVGAAYETFIGNSYAAGNVSGRIDNVGGLVGYGGYQSFSTPSIVDSHATGTVQGGGNYIGGLVGNFDSQIASIVNSYATGAVSGRTYSDGVSGSDYVGGLAGNIYSYGTLSGVYATGNVIGDSYVGGLFGRAIGVFANAYATGDVSAPGGDFVGGLFGYFRGNVTNAYATGNISGQNAVGGLVGYTNGGLANTYATGSVTGTYTADRVSKIVTQFPNQFLFQTGRSNRVAGLIGMDDAPTVSNSYATGAVTGESYVGGLVSQGLGILSSNNFWNVETTGQARGCAILGCIRSVGLTTAEMQDPFTFINAGWDLATVWGKSTTGANNGYLQLRTFATGLYDDYVKLGSGTRTYGDANSTISGAMLSGVGTGNVTLNWGNSVGLTTNAGTYSYSDPNVVTISETGARTAYIDTSGALTINQRALTVSADAQSKTYGNTNPTLTYTVSGLVNGDAVSGALSTAAGQYSDVGTYGITQGSLAASANYAISYTGADLTVTPRSVIVMADAQSRAYGDGNPTLFYSTSGLVNGDTLSGSLVTTATQYSDVGSYAITQGSLAASSNYALTYLGANLTIDPRALTVTVDAQSKTYGDVNPALTYTSDGLVNGDTLSGSLSTTAGQYADVGTYGITQGTLAYSSNYALIYQGANLTINQRALAVSANAQSKTYGDLNPTLTYSANGLVNGDTLSGALGTSAGQYSDVGTYGITQGTLAFSSNYALIYQGANLTINQRALTVSADAQSKTYGDANPTLTYAASGLVNGDTLSGALSTAAGLYANVGAYAIDLGSLGNANYAISYTGADLTIDRRDVIVQADGQTRVYGDVNPTLTYAASGLVNGDQLSGLLSTGAGQTSNVGIYAIDQGSLAASSNYNLFYRGASLEVTQRALTVAANAVSKVYGDALPTLTYTASGLVNGDSLSGMLSTTAGQYADVGAYGITQGTLDNSNYAISYTGADLTVTQRALTVTAAAKSRAYGDVNPALTYTASGLVNGDTVAGSLSTAAAQYSNVGDYGITGSLTASANYALTYVGANLTVTQRAMTVAADAQSKTYGNTNPTLTYTASGLVNGDSLSGALSTAAGQYADVGTYGITQGTLGNSNYAINYTGANLSVTPRALTVSGDLLSKVYGDVNPTLTYTVTGLVNGDQLTGSLTTLADQYSNVGTYSIRQGSLAASSNYVLNFDPGYLFVSRRGVTVSADAKSRMYGDYNPALTYTASGLVNGDFLYGSLSTTAGQYADVGTYGITLGTLDNSNYTISYTDADLTVTQRALTVAANAASKVYGDATPTLTYTASGLVNGDSLSGSLLTGASQYSNVGDYAILQGSLAASANYLLTYVGADLTVTQRAMTVAADAASKVYGDANPTLTYTASGLVNGDTLSGALSTAAGQYANVGAYAIDLGSLGNANYAISYTGADLTIDRRDVIVQADGQTRVYGNVNPTLTYAASGLVNGDQLSGLLSTGAGQTSNVGIYAIDQGSLIASSNYNLFYRGASLEVTQRALTVSANAVSKVYGDALPTLTYTASGLVNGDAVSGALSTAAGQYSDVGSYGITGAFTASNNYDLTFIGADLIVTPRSVTVTADAKSKIYGESNPVLTYAASGLVNGDGLTGELYTAANESSSAGTYAITQGSLVASANYRIAFRPSTLTVRMLMSPTVGTQASQINVAANFGSGFGGIGQFTRAPSDGAGQQDFAGGIGSPVSDPRNDNTVVCDGSGFCAVAATAGQP